jgi:cyanophycin synthetase
MENVDHALAYMREHKIKRSYTTALMVSRALQRDIGVTANRRGRALLKRGDRSYYYSGGITNFNTELAKRCVRNKDVTARLLRTKNVAAPESCFFSTGDTERAWAWSEAVLPVVVKPSNSTHGKLVHVGISDRQGFDLAFKTVSDTHGGALVEQFIQGVEHRVAVVAGGVVAATRRVPAHVVGDGVSTIDELVRAKNKLRKTSPNPIHFALEIDDAVRAQLSNHGLALDSVPADQQVVRLRATSNIHTGGDAVDATEDLSSDERELIERAARALPGLRVAGFDVLLPRNPGDADPHVLEVNHAPMLSMHHFPWSGTPRDVTTHLIDAMFPGS